MTFDTVVTGGKLVRPSGVIEADLGIRGGRIVAVGRDFPTSAQTEVVDARGLHVLPGLVDPEAHPGVHRSLGDDLASESRAALAAGVTTWGIQVTTAAIAKEYKTDRSPADLVPVSQVMPTFVEIGDRHAHVDYFLTPSLNRDAQAEEIPELARDWGVTSFKFHLHTQRGPELFGTWEAQKKGGHFGFDDGTVYLAMAAVAALGAPGIISIHPENWGISRALKERFQRAGYQETRAWDEHSPHMGEAGHVRLYAYYARLLGCPLYIQHVSTPETVREIEIARSDGATIVGQTGAHYLTLDHDTYRINVPLRDRDTIAALWRLLAVSDPSCVGSDHVCHTAPPEQMRTGNVWADISGFASRVEAMLPMMLSEGVNKGRISLERLVEVCCANTARAFGLYPRKGSLEVGADADVVLVDLQRTERIRPEMILSSAGWSAWEGWEVTGWPVLTMLRGRVASRWPAGVPRAEILGEPRGCYLARKVGHARYPLDPVEAPAQAIA